VEKIDDHSREYDKNADDNNPFSGIAVHAAKIRLNKVAMGTCIKSRTEKEIKKGTHN
jgi:hypothetical protein